MADMFDLESSSPLLCDESKDLCFDDLDDDDGGGGSIIHDVDYGFYDHHHQQPPERSNLGRSFICEIQSQPLILIPEQSDEFFASMLEREGEYLPKQDYLKRLRCGDLDLVARSNAFDWIFKAHSYYSFGPLSFCLAVNYFDRFLSSRELPSGKAWAMQLLAVACLSIASKIEESSVPQLSEFQVEDPKYVFEGRTIQRMELLVLDALNWRVNAITPCSFLDYSLKKLCDDANNHNRYLSSSTNVVNRSMQLITYIIRGIDFLEFRPSEIAAAAAMSVTAEIQAVDVAKACSCFIHLDKGRIMKCVEMIKENSGNKRSGSVVVGVPQSPIGVLEAGCFSYKSDELTTTSTTTTTTTKTLVVGSCANSTQITTTNTTSNTTTTSTSERSPQNKRIKLDTTTTTTTSTSTTNSSSSSLRLDS